MLLLIEFDCDADIIDVPQAVIDDREIYRRRFIKWIYNKSNKHQYWVTQKDNLGRTVVGVCFRSDAFVEWLNKKVLGKSAEKATVFQKHIVFDNHKNDMPSILF